MIFGNCSSEPGPSYRGGCSGGPLPIQDISLLKVTSFHCRSNAFQYQARIARCELQLELEIDSRLEVFAEKLRFRIWFSLLGSAADSFGLEFGQDSALH